MPIIPSLFVEIYPLSFRPRFFLVAVLSPGVILVYDDRFKGEAVWEKPTELSQTAQTVDGVPQFDNPEEWVCFLDENSGEEYWFNLTTGETHWGATSANNSTS